MPQCLRCEQPDTCAAALRHGWQEPSWSDLCSGVSIPASPQVMALSTAPAMGQGMGQDRWREERTSGHATRSSNGLWECWCQSSLSILSPTAVSIFPLLHPLSLWHSASQALSAAAPTLVIDLCSPVFQLLSCPSYSGLFFKWSFDVFPPLGFLLCFSPPLKIACVTFSHTSAFKTGRFCAALVEEVKQC